MGYYDRIKFSKSIMSNKDKNKVEQCPNFNITLWKLKVWFKIINDISENFTLLQLMDTVGNVNHAVSIVGYWIFYSNYKRHFPWQQNDWISYDFLQKDKECLPCLKQCFVNSDISTTEGEKPWLVQKCVKWRDMYLCWKINYIMEK